MKKSAIAFGLILVLALSVVFVSAAANSTNLNNSKVSVNATERIRLMEEERARMMEERNLTEKNATERIRLMEEERARMMEERVNRTNLTGRPLPPNMPGFIASQRVNLTDFGQCINDVAKIKNDCFASVKNVTSLCEAQKNRTGNWTEDCNQEVKSRTSQCKVDFQNAKKEQCGKIKHNFMQGFFAWFK
jgi:hypothetical protein